MPDKRSRIRELNDQLRCQHHGGTIMVTAGIQSMGADFIAAVDVALTKVTFDPNNDPYGEHDFGGVEVKGRRIFFKIDYYDQDLCFASPERSRLHVRDLRDHQRISRSLPRGNLGDKYAPVSAPR